MENLEVKVKYGDSIILLSAKQLEKLAESENSFFCGAIDFHKNQDGEVPMPIDITSAPNNERFPELLGYLENGFPQVQSIFNINCGEEILKLADYFGLLCDNDSLDIIAYRIRKNREEEIIKKLVLAVKEILQILKKNDVPSEFVIEKNGEHFVLTFEGNKLYSCKLHYMSLDMCLDLAIIHLKEILAPRLKYLELKCNIIPSGNTNGLLKIDRHIRYSGQTPKKRTYFRSF